MWIWLTHILGPMIHIRFFQPNNNICKTYGTNFLYHWPWNRFNSKLDMSYIRGFDLHTFWGQWYMWGFSCLVTICQNAKTTRQCLFSWNSIVVWQKKWHMLYWPWSMIYSKLEQSYIYRFWFTHVLGPRIHTQFFLSNNDIWDMIKRNEFDVADIVFEILTKTVFNFLYFILFLVLANFV